MKTKTFIIKYYLLFMLVSPAMQAQWQNGLWTEHQADKWYFGHRNGLDFSSGTPTILNGGQLNIDEGSACISDAQGNLLFYAGDKKVWNKNHQLMPNGTELLSGSYTSTQSGVIVPKPGTPGIYYLFNIGIEDGLVYSEIDMSLNQGLGDINSHKNIILDGNANVEKITAVYHADKERIWVISHRSGNNQFIAYLVSSAGVSTTPVISAVGHSFSPAIPDIPENHFDGPIGQLKVSPDGRKLAMIISGHREVLTRRDGVAELFDFNPSTGTVSNLVHLDFVHACYSLEFSPNSRYLYVIDSNRLFNTGQLDTTIETIYQFEATAINQAAVLASKIDIGSYNSRYGTAIQLAPNGRIYAYNSKTEGLTIINNPNNKGIASGLVPISTYIGKGASFTLPTFNQTYFQSGILAQQECQGAVSFSLLRIPDTTQVSWNFGDPDSGAENISDLGQHNYSTAGTYTVTAQITSNGALQTATMQLVIPSVNNGISTPTNMIACADSNGNASFALSSQNSHILQGLNANEYIISYYISAEDAKNNTNAIAAINAFVSHGQQIFVRVTKTTNDCINFTQFTLVVTPGLEIPEVPGLQSCDTGIQDGSAVFNLSQQSAALLIGHEGAEVAYFLGQNDADNNVNAISAITNFTNTSNPQTIFARVSDGCYGTSSFTLTVLPAPFTPSLPELQACESEDNKGFANFDLSKQESILLQGQLNVEISYYSNETDAIEGNNAIADTENFTNITNPQTIFVNIDNGSCSAIVSFKIKVLAQPSLITATPVQGCLPFDLNAAINWDSQELAVSYYTNEQDATEQSNAINNSGSYSFSGAENIVYVRGENSNGCFTIVPVTLLAGDCDVPRGISPNGDNMNDRFDLSAIEVLQLTIFDRYGHEVYSKHNYINEWEGQSGNNDLPTGTYYYAIELKDGDNKTGWVYINRQ